MALLFKETFHQHPIRQSVVTEHVCIRMYVYPLLDGLTADLIKTYVLLRGEEDRIKRVWVDTAVSVTLAVESAVVQDNCVKERLMSGNQTWKTPK